MSDTALKCLEKVKSVLLERSSDEELETQISSLGSLLRDTVNDHQIRHNLAHREDVWETLSTVLQEIKVNEDRDAAFYRLLRGVYLLVRNLASENAPIDLNIVYTSLQNVRIEENDIGQNLVIAWLQACSNCSQAYILSSEDLSYLNSALQGPILWNILTTSKQARQPLVSIMTKSLESLTVTDLLAKRELSSLVCFLAAEVSCLSDIKEPLEFTLVEVFEKFIYNESFNNWIQNYKDERDKSLLLVKAGQKVATSREDWDQFQLTAMLAWIYDLFVDISGRSEEQLTIQEFDRIELQYCHSMIIRLLDSLSHLCMFDTTRQFLRHYGAVEKLIQLLATVHQNVERKTLKDQKSEENTKSFPEVKSAIIEIIAHLAHKTFEVQEQVRSLHGLQIILSCCTIDDSNPYLKERAIVCIKQLLAGNEGNQNFVRSLEAQEVVDDKVLEEVGYEVKINDGKIEYRKRK